MSGVVSRRRWWVLLPLLAAAAWLAAFGDKTPPGSARVTAPASSSPTPAPPAAKGKAASPLEPIERLVPRAELVAATADASADLFASRDWSVKRPPAAAPVVVQAAPEPDPVTPNYRVLGKKLEDRAWEVFLGRDDSSFIVRAGDTLEDTWRVDEIAPPLMSLTHVPTGSRHQLAIGDSR